ncbi:MAG: 16S rRNA (cytidine(1402)-2'-O)-methyltransferase [Rhodanobacteraceae bacterium]|nr:16S rRNA (cytidine(1402)-2'-O)-methyltransferase [Rhodanobacteraceae bacterium]
MSTATAPSTLYVVATPIGNLDDLTPRARLVLGEVDAILCEDTRQSGVLLRHAGLARPLLAVHEHNEGERAAALVQRLREGQRLALISDAGTPLISDPGYRLVAAVRAAGFAVSPIPGPCALIAALSVAGLPTDRFSFEGFLPAKAGERRARLQAIASDPRTLVWYEAPHRIVETLAATVEVLGGERRAVIGRELTKRFETVLDGSLAELLARVQSDADQQRGEIVLVVAGSPPLDDAARIDEGRRLYALLAAELPPSKAARIAAAHTGAPKRALYGGGEG